MARPQVGDRVGAVISMNKAEAQLLGFGVYVGDEIPSGQSHLEFLAQEQVYNPKILLDNGDVVWGAECWWGLEAEVMARLQHCGTIKNVSITEYRAQFAVGPENAN